MLKLLKECGLWAGRLYVLYWAMFFAFDFRMHAIRTFGLVIHEFDPWFNFRATQYLADHGLTSFFHWYDYMSWSPLGRPVGSTIYPGMQIASVIIWKVLNLGGLEISLNDVCCYVPVGFGVFATFLIFMFTWITSGSANSATCAAAVMAVIPAHLMRSIGGGFDNESVAISCMCLTFTLWCYSISGTNRDKMTLTGILAGLAYVCMAATWGGFIFVLNLIGLHAFVLTVLGRYSNKLYSAYTMWYIVGTIGAMQVPVIGTGPIRSLEQLAPGAVFVAFQLIQLSQTQTVLSFFKVNKKSATTLQKLMVMGAMFALGGVFFGGVVAYLWPKGYFGPLGSRIRGLFITHTRTGNPLVDSVAEHQPASPEAFWQFLHYNCYSAPVGMAIAVLLSVVKPLFISDQPSKKKSSKQCSGSSRSSDPLLFVVLYGAVTYTFALKMNRLMLLMGPISAVCTGIAFGTALDYISCEIDDIFDFLTGLVFTAPAVEVEEEEEVAEEVSSPAKSSSDKSADGLRQRKKGTSSTPKKEDKAAAAAADDDDNNGKEKDKKSKKKKASIMKRITGGLCAFYQFSLIRIVRKGLAVAAVYYAYEYHHFALDFFKASRELSVGLSHPSIMFQATLRDGTEIIVDDYREAYWWLRDHTEQDARVMAWWDYGYQITGIGNRTSIADGNTWNHEHIALLGRCLTSPEKRAHKMIKHLADYVLLWTGGGGDDLAKSPHMARIGNSVFDDICPGDPLCKSFGFYQGGQPTPMMAESLLYKLHRNRIDKRVTVDPKLFREVYASKYGKVRIYQVLQVSKKSKDWAANATNRICDAPGSWYCNGQYPPALAPVLKKMRSFSQLEDFNKLKDEKAKKYHEEYMKSMGEH
jgi:dolichyl-diphosphooligosaccharide---protein glycosyltransferase